MNNTKYLKKILIGILLIAIFEVIIACGYLFYNDDPNKILYTFVLGGFLCCFADVIRLNLVNIKKTWWYKLQIALSKDSEFYYYNSIVMLRIIACILCSLVLFVAISFMGKLLGL